nr:Uncharacterised protein [Ipomoea batatas]GMD89793.1 Uncharacterised protein [Ipomoea batatas]
MAFNAASLALVFPVAVPIPINEEPALSIIARTSAKSTFTNPGIVIISEIPRTPCRKMSSARLNASVTGVDGETAVNNLSLGMTIRVSTFSLKAAIPSWA